MDDVMDIADHVREVHRMDVQFVERDIHDMEIESFRRHVIEVQSTSMPRGAEEFGTLMKDAPEGTPTTPSSCEGFAFAAPISLDVQFLLVSLVTMSPSRCQMSSF